MLDAARFIPTAQPCRRLKYPCEAAGPAFCLQSTGFLFSRDFAYTAPHNKLTL